MNNPDSEDKHVPMQHQADYNPDWSALLQGSFRGSFEDFIRMATFVKEHVDKAAIFVSEKTLRDWVAGSGFKEQNNFIGPVSYETLYGLPIVFDPTVPPGKIYIMNQQED